MKVAGKRSSGASTEAERLRVLDSYEILDTPPDEHFDQIARLAARLCQCPMAIVTLVDGRRQWFKARVGLDLPETSRQIAFCAHTIEADGLLQVTDAQADPRFADNPLVTGEPWLRFYAGVPLEVEDGHRLGALAVLDLQPRQLSSQEESDLRALGRQAVLALEERRLRMRAERSYAQARGQSDSLLAIAGRVARLGAWELDVDSKTVVWSDVVADIHGMPRGFSPDLESALNYYAEPDRTTLSKAVSECLTHGTSFDFEMVLQPANGAPMRWVRSIGEAVRDSAGRITHLRGACQDITEREQTLSRLRLLDACVRSLNDVVMVTDAQLDSPGPTIVFANPAAQSLSGWRPDELVGGSPRRLQGPLTQRDRLDALREALQAGRPFETDLINYRRSGEVYWVEVKVSPVLDGEGVCTHFVAVERDITERKSAESHRRLLEQRLLQSQKMESIGTLAGGIAHDFNNILGAVLGNAKLARDALQPDSPALRPLSAIAGSAERARSLVGQILAFARRQSTRRVPSPLRRLVHDTHRLLLATLPSNVSVLATLPSAEIYAEVDGNQIQQVLLNLCTNAWQALPQGGGTIELELNTAIPGGPEQEEPGTAHLCVKDNGCGIDKALLPRVFEPFFSTKAPGEGTGLGLSAAHGIVVAHGGTLSVESEPGVGTVFHVLLPTCEPPVAVGARPDEVAAPTLRGVRVLCVDDDPVMLMTMQALLEREGCRVEAAEGAQIALDRIVQQPDSVDVLVTDFNMPGMNGLALAEAVLQVRPALPLVLATGFMSDNLAGQALALGIRTLLHKERAVEELVPAVLQALKTVSAANGPGKAVERAEAAPEPDSSAAGHLA